MERKRKFFPLFVASMKNKKGLVQFFLISFFFASIIVGASSFSDSVFAQSLGSQAGSQAAAVAGIENGNSIPEEDGLLITAFKWLLYGLLLILVQFVQVGASVFAWATRPEYISGTTGLLNLDSVYLLWAFIRDFFNLFFIFLLLFSAFATVFQIEQYGLKKNFFKIIIAAVAINFSFPFTRIIIDLGNVPMYFFADGIVSAGATKENALLSIPNALFSSTGMGSIVAIPDPTQEDMLVPLITAIIFTFIFMITLVTLAFLFVLRLLKLVILLILSPIGVAASIVPGLKKFGSQWMGELLKTVFWGPAAMFMIVLALRFSAEIQGSGFAQGLSGTAPAQNATSQSSIIAQGVFFIPVIMMWMAMGIAKSSGIQGSKFITDKADKAVAWGKKQALFSKGSWTRAGVARAPGAARVRGIGAGIKDKFDDKISKPLKDRKELEEARGKALAAGILSTDRGSLRKEREKVEAQMRDKKAREQEKKWKDDGKATSEILKELNDDSNYTKDKDGKLVPNATALAAANYLANEKEAIKKAKDLEKVMAIATATGKKDLYDKALQSATKDALDLDEEQIKNLIDNEVRKRTKEFKPDPKLSLEENAKARKELREETRKTINKGFSSKMKKEGKLNRFLDYRVEQVRQEAGVGTDETVLRAIREDVYKQEKVLNMSAKDMAKQESLLKDEKFKEYAKREGKFGTEYINRTIKFAIEDGNVELEAHIREMASEKK